MKKAKTAHSEYIHITVNSQPVIGKKNEAITRWIKFADPKADVKTTTKGVLVENELLKELCKPSPQEIIDIPEETLDNIKYQSFEMSKPITEKGSTFQLIASTITTIEEANTTYRAVLSIPEMIGASQVMVTYKLKNGRFGYLDDRDYELGAYLLRQMNQAKEENRIYFLMQNFGGVHLGQKRFDIVRQLC